ncbi:MAG: hypothetical protein QY326_04335 [Bdellovibrionota bacterium]|nr:MAG: hypothetical protein QY326_04335 [Bdellovibrionota bacterium]
MRRSPALLLSLCVLLWTPLPALVEEPSQGRLPDGRAFRTDSEGNQLVDYIAELELNVADLNRRIIGLENEVEQKQQIIERLGSGQSAQGTLAEKDLLALSRRAPQEANCDDQVATVRQELLSARDDIDIMRTNHQREVAAYEQALADMRAAGASRVAASASPVLDCGPAVAKAESAKAELYAASLREKDIALQEAGMRAEENEQRYKAQIEELQTKLKSASEQSDVLKARYEQAVRSATEQSTRASQQPAESPARQRAVDSLKGNVTQELHRVRDLLAIREKLIGQYTRIKSPVEVRPSKAVSTRGRTHQDLSRELKSATSVVQLSYVQRDALEIKRKLQDDIALLERMIRLYGKA